MRNKKKPDDKNKAKGISFTGHAGIGKTGMRDLPQIQETKPFKISDMSPAMREQFAQRFSTLKITSMDEGQRMLMDEARREAFRKRFTPIKITPLSAKEREDLILNVVKGGSFSLAEGVTEKKVAATLRQKAFQKASVREIFQMLEKKGLIAGKRDNAPKPR